jgi:hypothetical protein
MYKFYSTLTLAVSLFCIFEFAALKAEDAESVIDISQNNETVISSEDSTLQNQQDPGGADGFTVFQYSVFSPIQLFPENYDVYGLRINALYGENRSMYGIDLGMYSALSNDMYGFQIAGVACSRDGDAFGISAAGIANMSIGDDAGLSVAGFMNLASGEFSGIQIGAVCRAQRFNGVQIGVFNHCDDFKGVQIGLVNICRNQSLPFTVLLNFRF